VKLSFKDKLLLVFVIVLIIFGIGYVVVLKPKMAKVSDNKDNLSALEAKKAEIETKISSGAGLEKKIKTEYEKGKAGSALFFSGMETLEVDRYVQSLLKANAIGYEGIAISLINVSTLNPYVFTPSSVVYPLLIESDLNPVDSTKATTDTSKTPATTTAPATTKAPATTTAPAATTKPATPVKGESIASCTITVAYTGTSDNIEKFLDAVANSEKKSLVVTGFTEVIDATGKLSGNIEMTMYFIQELTQPKL